MPSDIPRTPKDFLENLIDNICESVEQNPASLEESLKEEGYDFAELKEEGLQLVHTLEREQRLEAARAKREKLLELIDSVKQDLFMGNREKLVLAFKEIFAPGEAAVAFFHKLETIDDEDLREILNEATLLEIFEKQLQQQENPD